LSRLNREKYAPPDRVLDRKNAVAVGVTTGSVWSRWSRPRRPASRPMAWTCLRRATRMRRCASSDREGQAGGRFVRARSHRVDAHREKLRTVSGCPRPSGNLSTARRAAVPAAFPGGPSHAVGTPGPRSDADEGITRARRRSRSAWRSRPRPGRGASPGRCGSARWPRRRVHPSSSRRRAHRVPPTFDRTALRDVNRPYSEEARRDPARVEIYLGTEPDRSSLGARPTGGVVSERIGRRPRSGAIQPARRRRISQSHRSARDRAGADQAKALEHGAFADVGWRRRGRRGHAESPCRSPSGRDGPRRGRRGGRGDPSWYWPSGRGAAQREPCRPRARPCRAYHERSVLPQLDVGDAHVRAASGDIDALGRSEPIGADRRPEERARSRSNRMTACA